MKRKDFNYDLPTELIAQAPLAERSGSRLLCFNRQSGALDDRYFNELPGLFNQGDLLVFNDTRVIPARLFGKKASGGQVEILLERLLNKQDCLAQIRASKSPKPGGILVLEDGVIVETGDHQSLLAKGGRYATLHSNQFNEAI